MFFVYNRVAAVFLRLKDEKVLFLSESHQSLDGNLKAVCDALDDSFEKKRISGRTGVRRCPFRKS